jgi:hypothetical protein
MESLDMARIWTLYNDFHPSPSIIAKMLNLKVTSELKEPCPAVYQARIKNQLHYYKAIAIPGVTLAHIQNRKILCDAGVAGGTPFSALLKMFLDDSMISHRLNKFGRLSRELLELIPCEVCCLWMTQSSMPERALGRSASGPPCRDRTSGLDVDRISQKSS